MIDIAQFNTLAHDGFNRIPLVRDVLVDLDTPLSVYLKLANQPHSFLLESVQGGEKWGRYSIIGLPCQTRLCVRGHRFSVIHNDQEIEARDVTDPLQAIEAWRANFKVAPMSAEAHLPRFTGGLVGYFGYDTIRYIEPSLGVSSAPDPLELPDILLMVAEDVVIFDTLSSKLHFVVLVDPSQPDAYSHAQQRLNGLVEKLQNSAYQALRSHVEAFDPHHADTRDHDPRGCQEADFESGFTQAGFKTAVQSVKDLILAGDCMQVVLSQRMSIPYHAAPIELYRALRFTNPSPYMYFIHAGDHHIVGSSPEILVREEEGIATLRPIAGTRPRGATPAEDLALEQELLRDPKELAEHLMLIDLGRNDLGRIAATGSVAVTEKMAIERYSHVMHIVSNVTARLRAGITPLDVLKATFPAGTLSGAPKIRAMQIIDDLEPVKRGVYGGAVGYVSWSGNMDLAIAIRTAVIKAERLYIQAGAGIVHDSIPEMEWQETLNKGRAIFSAVARVHDGLDSASTKIAGERVS